MTNIKVKSKHSLGTEEAKKRVVSMEPGLRAAYGLDVNWEGNKGTFTGKNVDGEIDVEDDDVEIDLRLGLKALPFAGKIRRGLFDEMTKSLH